MTRSELQARLRDLGCKDLCDDGKTLSAYNQIQGFLYANRTPIKAIDKVYEENGIVYLVIGGLHTDSGIDLNDPLGW